MPPGGSQAGDRETRRGCVRVAAGLLMRSPAPANRSPIRSIRGLCDGFETLTLALRLVQSTGWTRPPLTRAAARAKRSARPVGDGSRATRVGPRARTLPACWRRSESPWAPSALKVVIVGVLGGELGYLSYLGAVALGAWIAGLRGGAAATIICALAQTILFSSTTDRTLTPYVVFNLGLFLLDGALVTILSSRLRRAYVRERSARTTGEADLEAQTALHEAAERDRVALTTLQAVTASLAGARTPVEVGDAILDRGLVALGAAAGGVSRVTDDGASVEVIAVRGYPDSEPGSLVALDHESHLRDAIESGKGVFLPNLDSWLARYPASPPRPVPGLPAGGAIAVLPMIAGSRTLGAIVFRFARDRDFDDGTRDLAIRLADQGAQALDRALAWDGDRRSREALERGQGRLALLVRASDVLGSGTDIGAGIAALPGLIVPALADWCAIELLDVDAPELEIGAAPEMRDAVQRLAGAAPRSLGSWLVPASAGDGPTILALGDQATTVPEAAADGAGRAGHGRAAGHADLHARRRPAGLDRARRRRRGPFRARRPGAGAGSRRPDRRRRGALEPVCRGHPVQGHRRRQRRRRVHVRPRLAPPDLCQPRRGRPAGRRARRARRDERARAAARRVGAGLPRPARRPPRRAVLDDDLLRGAGPGRRARVPGRRHPPGGDAARRDADGGPDRARHQRAHRRPGAAGPDRRRRATTGRGAARRHPVDGRGRPGRRRRPRDLDGQRGREPAARRGPCRGAGRRRATRRPPWPCRVARTGGRHTTRPRARRRSSSRTGGGSRSRRIPPSSASASGSGRARRGSWSCATSARRATPRPRARRSWASCRTSCGRR